MTHDHEHGSSPGSTPQDGHRSRVTEVRTFEMEPGLDLPSNGQTSSGSWSDDSARKADDALMRCYND